jgi:hypothetical protein
MTVEVAVLLCKVCVDRFFGNVKKSIFALADQNLQQRIERTNSQEQEEEKIKERVSKQIGIIEKKETEEPESQTLNRPTLKLDDAENATRQPHRQGNTKPKTQAEKADQKALKSINQMQQRRRR